MRILVVEDEENLGLAVRTGLEAEGFEVDLVTDGRAGLEAGMDAGLAAIVLDILLPGMNGFAICAELRQRGITTPILMLTAKDGELDEAEALDTGADDFLRKPFSFVVLVARLRALLRRRERSSGATMIAGDLSLDPRSFRAIRGGTSIDLTPREFALLAVLMSSLGEAITKADLLAEVWGVDFEGDPNIVEVYVGYLRRKIDQPFDRHAIETVRGVGYRLDPDGG